MSSTEEPRPARKSKEGDDAASVAGGAKIDETRRGDQMKSSTNIETGSGVYIGGSVSTGGGDFIGRDQIVIGSTVRVEMVFDGLSERLDALQDGPTKTMAATAIEGLKVEAKKGEDADPDNVQQWFDFLKSTAPEIFELAIATFSNPIEGIGKIFRKIALKARGD